MATQGRTRTRAVPERPQTRERGGGKDRGQPAGLIGAAGYQKAKEAVAKAEARREMNQRGPFRFWMENGEDPVEVIVLDNSVNDMFYMYEHEIFQRKARHHVVCLQDDGRCPLCIAAEGADKNDRDGFKFGYYAMYFTVIDTRGYTNKDGKDVPFARRLMCVKQSQIERFYKTMAVSEKKNGTLRGTVLLLGRDGEMSPRSGEPVMFEDTGTLFDHVTEKQLARDYSTPAIKKDGKIVKEKDADLKPFDYKKEFRKFTPEQLAKAWDLPLPPGSDAALEEEWDEDEETAPARGKTKAKVKAAPARGRRRPADEDDEDVEDDNEAVDEDDAEEAAPPPRSRRKPAPEPEDDDTEDEADADADDGEDEDEEETPPPRGRARSAPAARGKAAPARGKTPARGTRSRTVVEEDDDGDEIPF